MASAREPLPRIAERFLPLVPRLAEAERAKETPFDAPSWKELERLWAQVRAEIERTPALREAFLTVGDWPGDEDALAGFRFQLRNLFARQPRAREEWARLWDRSSSGTRSLLEREPIRICCYNLHGTHQGDSWRYLTIARELASFTPDVISFQEAISGAGIEETSAQVARSLSSMTGAEYKTRFAYCHFFLGRYPEGIAVSSRHPLTDSQIIDLTIGLKGGLKPSMERYALAAELMVKGRKLVALSIHLDHSDPAVRGAQAEKLVEELEHSYGSSDYAGIVLAGDFNDLADSPALSVLKASGYRDLFQARHSSGGNTYPCGEPSVRIDYILAKGDFLPLWADVGLDDPKLSDHLGVLVVLL
jgi:endonuclease/exonuclease/phosphatase family metal-dependent hydrolase